MKNLCLTAVFLLMAMWATGQETNPLYDSTLAARLEADDNGMKQYMLVILKTGPAQITDQALRDSLFKGHFSNMSRLAADNKLVVAGPIGKNDRNYRGIFIFNVKTVGEAEALVMTDPTVVNGIFDAEIYPWYGSAALPVYMEYADKVRKKKP